MLQERRRSFRDKQREDIVDVSREQNRLANVKESLSMSFLLNMEQVQPDRRKFAAGGSNRVSA